jgi:hypothetical protein
LIGLQEFEGGGIYEEDGDKEKEAKKETRRTMKSIR